MSLSLISWWSWEKSLSIASFLRSTQKRASGGHFSDLITTIVFRGAHFLPSFHSFEHKVWLNGSVPAGMPVGASPSKDGSALRSMEIAGKDFSGS